MAREDYADIQTRYRAEMRSILPGVLEWWRARAQSAPADIRDPSTANAFEKRWPAGPAGHPRILSVFRTFFAETEALNDDHAAGEPEDDPPSEEDLWGLDEREPGRPFVAPADLLITDLQPLDPKLFEVLQGLVFIPIGIDPGGGDS